MKTRHGFTLIEMLVVVAIIMILAGLLLPVIKQAIEQGRRTRALAEIKQIETAWKEYKREYARYYNPAVPDPILMDSNAVAVLSGLNTNLNPKAIQFFEATPSASGMLDPWKAPYRVAFDDDRNGGTAFDNVIVLNDGTITGKVYSSVAVWSKGRNTGNSAKDAKDDVTSWKR